MIEIVRHTKAAQVKERPLPAEISNSTLRGDEELGMVTSKELMLFALLILTVQTAAPARSSRLPSIDIKVEMRKHSVALKIPLNQENIFSIVIWDDIRQLT